jgi:hypothetical protein
MPMAFSVRILYLTMGGKYSPKILCDAGGSQVRYSLMG